MASGRRRKHERRKEPSAAESSGSSCVLRRDPCHQGDFPRGQRRGDRDADRRQRRGKIHHAEHHRRAAETPAGRDRLCGDAGGRHGGQQDGLQRPEPLPGRPADFPADDRPGKPGNGRFQPAQRGNGTEHGAGVRIFPAAQGTGKADCRYAVRRRTADAGHGAGADEQAAADDAGRTQHGPGADPGRADL